MTPKLLAVDTSVALYWTMRKAPESQEARWGDAIELFEGGPKTPEWDLALPANALAEIPSAVPRGAQEALYFELARRCIILPFDAHAAKIAGTVAKQVLQERDRDADWPTRHQLKVDIEIMACAFRHRCDGLCTFDSGFLAIAERLGASLNVAPPSAFLPPQIEMGDRPSQG